MTQLFEIATKVIWIGTMAYFPIVIVALALLKPFMEKQGNHPVGTHPHSLVSPDQWSWP
jgi:hypothetical protein